MWERTLSQKLVRLFCEQKVGRRIKRRMRMSMGTELLISSVVSILLVHPHLNYMW